MSEWFADISTHFGHKLVTRSAFLTLCLIWICPRFVEAKIVVYSAKRNTES